MAERTGLEPATPCVTGRYSNRLNYRSTEFFYNHRFYDRLTAKFDAWQFPTLAWGDPTLPSALRRFTSEFGMGSGGTTALLPPDKFFSNLPNFNLKSGADTQSRTGDLTLTKGALYQLSHISTLNLMPGSSLLSHGETPHYHRRYGVSLLSSAWGQVGPPR